VRVLGIVPHGLVPSYSSGDAILEEEPVESACDPPTMNIELVEYRDEQEELLSEIEKQDNGHNLTMVNRAQTSEKVFPYMPSDPNPAPQATVNKIQTELRTHGPQQLPPSGPLFRPSSAMNPIPNTVANAPAQSIPKAQAQAQPPT
jgi:hypothetical protein